MYTFPRQLILFISDLYFKVNKYLGHHQLLLSILKQKQVAVSVKDTIQPQKKICNTECDFHCLVSFENAQFAKCSKN